MKGLRLVSLVLVIVFITFLILFIANQNFNPLPQGVKATHLVVEKADRKLNLIQNGQVVKSYPVSFGAQPKGDKIREGDERTPEGTYIIDWRNENSSFYLSMHISYPDSNDRKQAQLTGNDPGGMIMIHGMRNGLGWLGKIHRMVNWTDGCIALTNYEMDELWRAVDDGTKIEIRP